MKNISTINFEHFSHWLHQMQQQNSLTSLPLSQNVFIYIYLSVGIYRIIFNSNREGGDNQTDLLQFFLI